MSKKLRRLSRSFSGSGNSGNRRKSRSSFRRLFQ